MKIKQVCEVTGLTDRTVRYYIEEELISPTFTENYLGRRNFDFTDEDVKALNDIAVLRKFGFTVLEIKGMLDNSETISATVKALQERKQGLLKEEQELLQKLSTIEITEQTTARSLAELLAISVKNKVIPYDMSIKSISKQLLRLICKTALLIIAITPLILVLLRHISSLTYYEYPVYTEQSKIYSVLVLIPTFLFLFMHKISIPAKTKKYIKYVIVAACVFCSWLTLAYIEPIVTHSETTDIQNYRKYDAKCLANRSVFHSNLFPTWPHYIEYDPEKSTNAYIDDSYYLYRFWDVVDYTYDIYAEWSLEKAAFNNEVKRVRELYEALSDGNSLDYVEMEKGKYTCLIYYDGDNPFKNATNNYSYHIFAYDKESLRVRYITCVSLENGADQPYYLELDW